ncbi:hypothetical protein TBLA_0A09520 [Henningerozyma blattae CBS 6284]|uniref:Growth regulation protein n=1 Tax=Henningerozyma blattae (strain ATCC 34711 / CBS 6284 / DSM 70876 / NBRC 10599 / NRRL Y-10934 / UCD 77-7) TaxID=1071380 RepID=I2GX85_HENB6|nr:hypothetical protein TBLA_0A09520 [Tetrapisispora blattae CBS 6284]CCH58737.1 hypothetical protein TBLA_0A09520 [Tetrapisispora blattae CBS 6284]
MENIITQIEEPDPIITSLPIFNANKNAKLNDITSNPLTNTITNVSNNSSFDNECYIGDMSSFNAKYLNIDNNDGNNFMIHLNIQHTHFYITRDQLLSLPESLLLCLFPSGVFLDIKGQVINNLNSSDMVFITNFSPNCFNYILNIYNIANHDLLNNSPSFIYNNYFPFNRIRHNQNDNHTILHENPIIILLREDLDYYVVLNNKTSILNHTKILTKFDRDQARDILTDLMKKLKILAGNYLIDNDSIFNGLYNDYQEKNDNTNSSNATLGTTEKHLVDMLYTSGFHRHSQWASRVQEKNRTIISSLSLQRVENETTESFRQKVYQAQQLENYNKHQNHNNTFCNITNVVRSKSLKRHSSPQECTDAENNGGTKNLYDLVPKPKLNDKLLLFWKRPARKCWWNKQEISFDIRLDWRLQPFINPKLIIGEDENALSIIVRIPIKLHIRRVWTLELSILGA